MVKCILIKKGGTIKCSNLKLSSLNEIYKKCGFMNNNYFDSRNIWSLDNKSFYTIYSKNKGKAGSENKYDLPPPIDSELYFGTMVILKHSEKIIDIKNLQDLTVDDWQNVYNTLFGGFEDLDDDEESSDEEEVDPEDLTKEGYLKDAASYHKSLSLAMHPDSFAKFFYEQGKSDAVNDITKESKNIDMNGIRNATQSVSSGGFKVSAVSSSSGSGLRIKSNKNKN